MEMNNKVGAGADDPLLWETSINSNMALVTNFIQDIPNAKVENHKEKPINDSQVSSLKRDFTRENSAFQLIMDNDEDRMRKLKTVKRIRGTILVIATLCTIGLLCTMTALYLSERQRRVDLASANAKDLRLKQIPDSTTVKSALKVKSYTPKSMLLDSTTVKATLKTISDVYTKAMPLSGTTTSKATTTKKPSIKPIVPGCSPVFDAYPLPKIPPEVEKLKVEMNAAVENLYKSKRFKAASVAFSYRGKIWWSKHVGRMNYSDLNSSLPNNDTPYPVASITKLFTTFMLHKLSEKDKLELDDPVKRHEPKFSVKNPFNKEKITLRQLSCMMSGLPREAPCYPHTDTNFCPYNSSVMWERIANLSLILPPDKNPSYSNLGYSVLGRTLEGIAGEKYEDWITNNILKPLGMTNSGFDTVESSHRFPVSTNIDGSKARIIDWGWQSPAAGLYSTIHDLNQVARLLFELINGTTVLHKSTARKLFKPAYLFNNGHGTGYGFEIVNTAFRKANEKNSKVVLDYLMYGKSGATLGYGSWVALIPEIKFAAFVLVAHGGLEFMPRYLLQIALKALDPLEQVLVRSLPQYVLPPNPEIFIGNFTLTQYWPLINNIVKVYIRDGILYLNIEWLHVPLSYDSSWVLVTGHFRKYPPGGCEDTFLNTGLSHLKCYFRKPSRPGGKSPGFHVYGLSAYGFADFKRV